MEFARPSTESRLLRIRLLALECSSVFFDPGDFYCGERWMTTGLRTEPLTAPGAGGMRAVYSTNAVGKIDQLKRSDRNHLTGVISRNSEHGVASLARLPKESAQRQAKPSPPVEPTIVVRA